MNLKRGLGCTAGVLGVMAILAGFFYLTVFRPAGKVLFDLDQMASLRDQNARILDRADFLPPVDGLLPDSTLARFARVQTAMRAGAGQDFPFLAERAGRLHGLLPDDSGKLQAKRLGLREAILAMEGLGLALARAKERQVNALNAEGFSLPEYRWVRETFYSALGISRANVYFEDFAASVERGETPAAARSLPPPLEPNREMAAAYSDSVRSWFPFLVFGL